MPLTLASLRLLAVTALFVAGSLGASQASSIIPQPWQAIVNRAGLVGIVECETAGEIVAKYRVVESWHGPVVGSKVVIRGSADVFGPNLPAALIGERFLVAARQYREDVPLWSGLFLSPGPAGGLPLYLRPNRADFFLQTLDFVPLSVMENASGTEPPLDPLSYVHPSLDAFRRDVLEFFSLAASEREAEALRSSLVFYYIDQGRYSTEPYDTSRIEGLLSAVQGAPADSIVREVVRVDPEGTRASHALMVAGREETLRAMADMARQGRAGRHGTIIESLERALGLKPYGPGPDPRSVPVRPPRDSLEAWRTKLRGSVRSRDHTRAFEVLSSHDPQFVISYLLEWVPSGEGLDEGGYEFGSYFAWRHKGHSDDLKRLLRAADPYIRVAAALQLELDRPGSARKALQELSTLRGDPGAWAAFELARRGEKGAVPRALEILRTAAAPTSSERNHTNLQKRLLVLLSNSAKASAVDQPGRRRGLFAREPGSQEDVYAYYAGWWRNYERRMKLYDPWFKDLERAKMD